MLTSTAANLAPRILIIRLSAIGDVLHSTAVIHNLKRIYPQAQITWLVSPPADILLQNNPDIDRLLVWDRRQFDKAIAQRKWKLAWQSLKQARQLLRQQNFDMVLDIQGLFLTGLLAKLSGSKRRIGIHERHEGNFLFMSEMAPNIADRHKIRRYMTALFPLGITQQDFIPGLILKLPANAKDFAKNFWQQHHITTDRKQKILLVNIRTTWPDKNWAPLNFATALQKLPPTIQIVFTGAASDTPYITTAQHALTRPSLSIAGQTSLMELAALIASSDLLLTGDTGPLYIAEAVGTTTLSLWGPTHPDIYGPLTPGHHFIISPHNCTVCCKTHCKLKTNACMAAIEPNLVTQKLQKLLNF